MPYPHDSAPAGPRRLATVVVPLPVDRGFDYVIPPGMDVQPGMRVIVPYGHRDFTATVIAIHSEDSSGAELKAIREVADLEPVVSSRLLETLLDAARDSLSPPGLALASALPPGAPRRQTTRLMLAPAGERALAHKQVPPGLMRSVLESLAARPLAESTVRERFPQSPPLVERMKRLGWVTLEASLDAGPRARTETLYSLAENLDWDAVRHTLRRSRAKLEILETLRAGPSLLPATPALRALIEKAWVRAEQREVLRQPSRARVEAIGAQPELTAHQASVVHTLEGAIDERAPRVFLLQGVTGSGKTEVYLQAAARTLERSRGVIVLVPEISLTHQLVDRFRGRFGDRVAVLHSGLGTGERFDQWRQIHQGACPIVIGARSAIFAPLADVGLIAIDEEHDPAYATDEAFGYDARAIAERLARAHGCPVLLGSATPDVTTAYRASRGEIERLELPERIGGRPLPGVEIIDMTREPRGAGPLRALSRALRKALAETLAAKEQAILFLNRRGFAPGVYCFRCGTTRGCKHCDIGLVYHASGVAARTDRAEQGELRCHYCGYREDPCDKCPGCGKGDASLLGFGTERVEEEVAATFPHARVARLDRDSSARKGEQQRILAELHRGECDVLVGTQMVAKGHDVPRVTLVGVIAADLGLHFPDYRAGERTFQLLTQVAGRAGRGALPGRVIVQSFLPDHYAIAHARDHDYERFWRDELARRQPHGYPPLRTLARVEIVGENSERVSARAEELAALARKAAAQVGDQAGPEAGAQSEGSPTAVEVLGPAPAPRARVRDRYRWQILLLGPADGVRETARALLGQTRGIRQGVEARVVLSPSHML